MTKKLAEWASEHDQIIKSGLSWGHQEKFLPSVAGFAYDWLRFKGYLGNIGLNCNQFVLLCSKIQSCLEFVNGDHGWRYGWFKNWFYEKTETIERNSGQSSPR